MKKNKELIQYSIAFVIFIIFSITYYLIDSNRKENEIEFKKTEKSSEKIQVVKEKSEILKCKHISKWVLNYTNCQINSNWSKKGKINCIRYGRPFPIYTDYEGKKCDKKNTANPGTLTEVITLNLKKVNSDCFSLKNFANGKNSCFIDFDLTGIPKEGISGLEKGIIAKNFSFSSGAYLDQINNKGEKGLLFQSNSILSGSIFRVNIKSIAPLSNSGTLSFELMGTNKFNKIEFDDINLNFNKLFRGNLSLEGGNNLKLGENRKLVLYIEKTYINDYNISEFKSSLMSNDKNSIISNIEKESNLNFNPSLVFKIKSNGKLESTETYIYNTPTITYNIGGKTIKYSIGKDFNTYGNKPLELYLSKFVGTKIIGDIKVGDNDLRKKIKELALKIIEGISSSEYVGKVKYIENENITLNGEQDFETLIVKNGNVIIDGDLNKTGKPFGIIVLTDKYDTKKDYTNSGNIYVSSGVGYINAYLYAEGGLISSNNAVPYTSDGYNRTLSLKKQLVIKGNIFTKNTIGGANLFGKDYLLPNNRKTNNFNNSMIYDLNFLRKGNTGWDGNDNKNDGNTYNLGNSDPLVLIYNDIKVIGFSE